MKQFWKFQNAADGKGTELLLEGVIASESWWGDEVTPEMFRKELKNHPGDITVVINSPGGDVFAGVAIYNALKQHDGVKTVRVDGLAASIASIVAMAGDKIIMSPGSMMMIHKPWTLAIGDSEDMKKTVEVLEGIEASLIPIYANRSGLDESEVETLLSAETWMTAQEAVEKGFADEFIEATKKESTISDAIKNVLGENGHTAYTPAATTSSIMNLAEKIKAKDEADEDKTPEVPSELPVETPAPTDAEEVTDTPVAETKKPVAKETPIVKTKAQLEEEARLANEALAAAPADEVKTPETPAAEIAKDQVITPADQPKPEDSVKVKDYLKSEEAMEAFAQILHANPGETGGGSSAKVRDAWKEHLTVKAGVTNPDVFLPTPLIEAIQNAFEDGGEIWNRVSKSGVDVWNAAWDTEDDVNSNDGRGRGYNRDDAADKAEQVLTFDSRIIRAQFVYKYITLNKEDIKEQRSTGALVTYILSELPQRIVREVERAIVLGDGRASDDDYKIKEGDPRGFYPILADAVAGNFFADEVTLVGDESRAEVVAKAKDEIRTGGEVVLIAKKGYSTSARFEKDSEGRLLFPLGSKASDVLDIDVIIEPDWFNDTNSPDVDAIVVVLSAYRVVGDTTIEGFQNFILKTNKQEYLQEIWAGGGLTGKKSAIAVPTATS